MSDAGDGDAHPSDSPQPEPSLVAPEVITRVEPVLPVSALAAGAHASVVLTVTIDRAGLVTDVRVTQSAGEVIDAAAVTAMRQWRFKPGAHAGQPIVSRVHIPLDIHGPELPVDTVPAPTAGAAVAPSSAPQPAASADQAASSPAFEVTVVSRRERREDDRSASDFHVAREVLAAAPRAEGAEVLRSAPGVYIGRGEGAAVAHSYMLRGFDAEHGQDIEFRVGGLPINQPSHIHGQGYADLGFLVADSVQRLHVSEGVYDPRQGDFAVAGSIDIDLGVDEAERGLRWESSIGSFGTTRHQLLWAPPDAERETFGAVQYSNTDGFGENRAGESASATAQVRLGEGRFRYRVLSILHTARANLAGVVRDDDVRSGDVCFTCVYPLATARAQNALAQRVMLGAFVDYRGTSGDNAELGIFAGYDNFRLQENFTGFTRISRTLERTSGRGDLIEQRNQAGTLGLQARYRSATLRPHADVHGSAELGVSGRLDLIDQTQNLLDATARNQTWDRLVDASIVGSDLGFWGDLSWSFWRRLRARVGVRADVLGYDVDDRLGNFATLIRPQDTYIVGYRRSAYGTAVGPRTSLELKATKHVSLRAAYGEGYRSPQARSLEDSERAPFTKVRSADVGVRLDWGAPLQMTFGGYFTQLSDDIAFDAEEGRLERIGATRRLGLVAHAQSQPAPWLIGALSVTWVHASLLEPPPATTDEPTPPFVEGQSLPYVPPLVIRVDLGAHKQLVEKLGPWALAGRAGAGLSFLSERPLPYGQSIEAFGLLDMSAELQWGPIDLSLEIYNLLDAQYAALAYSFASSWDPEAPRSRVPALHTAAGSPRSLLVTLGVTL